MRAARPRPSAPLRLLRPSRHRYLRCVLAGAAPHARAVMRALRRADYLAGASLSRVLRSPDRLHVCSGCGSLRAGGAPLRRGLEGAGPPRAGSRRRGLARRRGCAAARRRAHVRARRPGSRSQPRAPSGCEPRRKAWHDLGRSGVGPPRSTSRREGAAGVGARGSPSQRRRRVRRVPVATRTRDPRRRRLHDRRDRLGSGPLPPARGSPPNRRGHVRANRAPRLTPSLPGARTRSG